MRASGSLALLLLLALSAAATGADEVVISDPNFSVDISPDGNQIVTDLLGDIWTLPTRGGRASRLIKSDDSLSRPSFSPDGTRILYHAITSAGSTLHVADVASRQSYALGPGHRQDGAWHPDGNRIAYAADQHGTGLDIWEIDLPTGLSWRLTSHPGDETEPAWSANGRHLAWIRHHDDRYALVLRRAGEPETTLVESDARLSAPSWRPDGSLLMIQRHEDGGFRLEMVILSDPVLVRQIDPVEDMIPAPVRWRDRMNMLYTADQSIRTRGFEDRRSRPLHFRALVDAPDPPPPREIVRRELTVTDAPEGRLIIRGARLFDGIWQGYRPAMDVIVESGRIAAIEAQRPRDDGTVLDLGNVTIIPGLVDTHSALARSPLDGAGLLAYGVTTIAVDDTDRPFEPRLWEGESTPGPRLLHIDDVQRFPEITSIADAASPGIASLLGSRQATLLGQTSRPPRRFSAAPDLATLAGPVAVGSKANRLAPGLALHAELRALQAAGLSGEQALHAAGKNGALLLGAENQVGTIVPGALADLVLVSGDPLEDVSDTLNIVAVVRNGRFFSAVSLLERAVDAVNVE